MDNTLNNPDLPRIGGKTWPEFIRLVENFHGYAAPGALLGGIMVELARERLLELRSERPVLFIVMAETYACLPDAVQLLTPCTVGNQRLHVLNLNRYALSFFAKPDGQGARVFVDNAKLGPWPHLRDWFMGITDKKDQDEALLCEDIRQGGAEACSVQLIKARPEFMSRERKGRNAICPICGEPYPLRDGESCLGCRESLPFELS